MMLAPQSRRPGMYVPRSEDRNAGVAHARQVSALHESPHELEVNEVANARIVAIVERLGTGMELLCSLRGRPHRDRGWSERQDASAVPSRHHP